MKRTLHISTQTNSKGRVAGGTDKCMVRIIEGINTVKLIIGVNYGLAITNIMEEWGCSRLRYGAAAREVFLGKPKLHSIPAEITGPITFDKV